MNLIAVGEIFFPWENKACHQICFYYKVQLEDMNSIPLDGYFLGYDEFDNQRIDLGYHWIPLHELKNGLNVYPLELIPYILEDSNEIKHFISKGD
ncbi:MAG: hypothetical protein ACI4U3_07085 [Traorella sp.]